MCEACGTASFEHSNDNNVLVEDAVGMVLAHDITEIRQDEFKGRAFKKGHIIRQEDIEHLRRLGKERLYVLRIGPDEIHEDDAAYQLATALMGEGVEMEEEPKEGKINIVASRDGLLKIQKDELLRLNMLGEVMCATLHNNSVVKRGQIVAGTRAIPLIIKKAIIERAVQIGKEARKGGNGEDRRSGIIEVKELKRPKAGIVITGNEVYYGRIKDAFAPIIKNKIQSFGGEIIGIYYSPDDVDFIEARLRDLLNAGADLLITTGGMSVDPDDVTRFAIRKLGATDITYGSAVLPGAMFLVAYIAHNSSLFAYNKKGHEPSTMSHQPIPILGIPACGMYHKTTVFDLILPRVLAKERIGRKEIAELGHGGLCLNCKECRYPVCPFGK